MDCKPGNIDLHTHSTASDGSLNPVDILALAEEAGLSAIAITDHDAVDGASEIINYGIPPSIRFLTGVEISAAPPAHFSGFGSFHILGYGFFLGDPALNTALKAQQAARENRTPRVIRRLNELGLDLSLEEIASEYPNARIGRPHIAAMMVKKGFAASIDQVFDTWIGRGKPAYVDKPRIETQKAVDLIRAAGGVPVLAHPGLLEIKDDGDMDLLVSRLASMGIGGLEAYYPGHTKNQTELFKALAARHSLLVTGGTDFHGEINPEIRLGVGYGDFCVPWAVYETLVNEINRL